MGSVLVVAALGSTIGFRSPSPETELVNNGVQHGDSEASRDPEKLVLRFQRASFGPWEEGTQESDGLADVLRSLLGPEVSILERSGFLLAGDVGADQLSRCYAETIEPATRAICFRYLTRLPDETIAVILLRNSESYRAGCRRLFARDDFSNYGFYSPEHRALVLNLATGPGTLVHELTHALVDRDFPNIPDWFNEGFASLHEECRFVELESGPSIDGLVNWRLLELQEALARGELRPLPDLLESDDFRGERMLLNYAHARYLCLYLQDQGKLQEFYVRFRGSVGHDPSGAETLLDALEESEWPVVEHEFRTWLASLQAPGNSAADSTKPHEAASLGR